MRSWCCLIAVVFLCVSCTASREAAFVEDPQPAPTFADARNATYHGLSVGSGSPITLTEGRWEGEPAEAESASRPSANLVREFVVFGDIDSGGIDETAVLLADRSGGTGEFLYIALLDKAGEEVTNTATLLLGDRVQVRSVLIEAGSITAEVIQSGLSDAACCPGDIVRRRWELQEGALVETAQPQPLGRLSPETIGETECDSPVIPAVIATQPPLARATWLAISFWVRPWARAWLALRLRCKPKRASYKPLAQQQRSGSWPANSS